MTSLTVFGNKASNAASLDTDLGGHTASAGNILFVVVSAAGANRAADPVISDNVGSAGWTKVVDHVGATYHATYWTKICVGAENNVHVAPSGGSIDMAVNGALAETPTFPTPYIIDQGLEALGGGKNTWTATVGPNAENQPYVVLTANGSVALVSTHMTNPSNNNGQAQQSSTCNTVVLTTDNEVAHHTTDRITVDDDQSALLSNYVVWLGLSNTVAPQDYVDSATVTMVGVVSALEYENLTTQTFNVNDTSVPQYVRAGRANIISVSTLDKNVTLALQVSGDGETWYNAYNSEGEQVVFAVTAAVPVAKVIQPGYFHYRLKCTVAASGAATCHIGTNGGY